MGNSVYEMVTNRIIELLEEGTVPWQKPWRSSEGPRNLISKKPYRGINSILLNCSPFESDFYLTYNQAKERGGQVRKGEKSTIICFWKWIDRKDSDDQETTDPPTGKVPLLRYYLVFNVDQVDGIDPPEEKRVSNPFTPIEQAEQIIRNMPQRPDIKHAGNHAYYLPFTDQVKLPPKEAFKTPADYYKPCFHELGHSTGHANRVGRKGITEPTYFGTHCYSHEELVAEFTASMLCGVAGIDQSTIENSAAYIQSWLKVLRKDKKILVHAAAQAQKSADFILGKEVNSKAEGQGQS
ncbi:MAG: zincin-like metallopeptidase domain-containing protein [Candidatus Bathyarchaeota archaeon]|nr:zincin-like metallopeptidase domain-containing protein [Candidatus Bathyarchaeota archaeon]